MTIRLCSCCLTLTLTVAACGGNGGAGRTATVTDSAGVEIVTSAEPVWRTGDAWTVDPTPAVSIGTFDGEPEYEFYQVRGATRFADGTIAVLNSGSFELRFYDESGEFIRSVGAEGEGPGEFRGSSRLFNHRDSLLVWDFRLNRLSVFAPTGEFVRSFLLSGSGRSQNASKLVGGALLTTTSTVYTPSSEGGIHRDTSVYVMVSLDGDSLSSLGRFPEVERFVRLSGDGMTVMSLLLGRTTRRASSGDQLFVGTNESYAIDIYDRDGRLARSIRREVPPVLVTDEMFTTEVERRLKAIPARFRANLETMYEVMPKVDALPFYAALQVDAEGNLWVRNYSTESEPANEWSVFDRGGMWLGDVTLPAGLTVYEIGSDYVLGSWQDEVEVEHVRIHALERHAH